jgi:phage tail-like protein
MADVNSKKVLPFRNFKFRVYLEGQKDPIAFVSKMSALKKTTQVIDWRCGGDSNAPRKLPGTTKTEPVVFERGLAFDIKLIHEWANRVNDFDTHLAINDNDFKKEMRVELLDLDGNVVLKYNIHACWISEYTALPDLDANANAVAISSMKVENEGWTLEK